MLERATGIRPARCSGVPCPRIPSNLDRELRCPFVVQHRGLLVGLSRVAEEALWATLLDLARRQQRGEKARGRHRRHGRRLSEISQGKTVGIENRGGEKMA
jgi:hypothetical protein